MGIFEFLRRKNRPSGPGEIVQSVPLVFRDAPAAFEYACRYLDCSLREGSLLPAIVLDAAKHFGTANAVSIRKDGTQLAMIRVASTDGGFVVAAETISANGPRLVPGLLVGWRAMKYVSGVGSVAEDERFGWCGLILGTLKSEWRDGGWVGDKRYDS